MSTTPYHEALAWINHAPGTGSASNLARLVLSFYNSDCSYAFSECIGNLDSERTAIALRMAAYYAKHGEDAALQQIGRTIADAHPRMWELGMAMRDARRSLRDRWEREAEAERAQLYPDG